MTSVECEALPSISVPGWPATSDNSCKPHWPPEGVEAKSKICAKSSLISCSTSGCQHRRFFERLGDCRSGWSSLSNDSYASWLANDEVRYQDGRGVSKWLSEIFVEVRLGKDNAFVRNVERDLRTMSFDYMHYSARSLISDTTKITYCRGQNYTGSRSCLYWS